MNTWQRRLLAGAAFWAVANIHAATVIVPNTVAGMLMYHGSAAMVDLACIWIASVSLRDSLRDDIQIILFASMVTNALGWIAYICYISPQYYDVAIAALALAQYARLIWVGKYDRGIIDHMGNIDVRCCHNASAQRNFGVSIK